MTSRFGINVSLVATILITCSSLAAAEQWPHWRGPEFNGSADARNLPVKWSRTENVAWKADLPGPAASTPIICDDNVYITSTDLENSTLLAMCFSRTTGKLKWKHTVREGDIRRDRRSYFAAPSPVTNGEIIVFFFSTGELLGYTPEGKQLWSRNIKDDYGEFAFLWTFSSSPTIVGDKVYLQVLQRDVPVHGRGFSDRKNESYLLAVDINTGKTVWREVRPSRARAESHEAFSTPIPATINGKQQLLVVGGDAITGHNLDTGKELWRWGTYNRRRIGHWRLVPSPVEGKDVVLVCAPKNAPIYAITPKQTGKLSDDSVLWTSEDEKDVSSDVPTPAFYDGDFFVLSDLRKTLSRVEPKTGKVKWTVETPGNSKFEASPLAADGKLYLINHAGDAVVFNAADGELLNTIDMDDPQGGALVRASIATANNQLFIRTSDTLYCIGK